CSQRLQNLKILRDMEEEASKPNQEINVYRDRKWVKVKSHQLLPGDLCSITRTSSETVCPCMHHKSIISLGLFPSFSSTTFHLGDVLLLSGSCVVDESMLTGESIPQLKVRYKPTSFISALIVRERNPFERELRKTYLHYQAQQIEFISFLVAPASSRPRKIK